jgi:hypothetical protein
MYKQLIPQLWPLIAIINFSKIDNKIIIVTLGYYNNFGKYYLLPNIILAIL